MPSKYAVHPMELKFRDDMIEMRKQNQYIKEVLEECEELGITEPSRMVRHAFMLGGHYERLKRVEGAKQSRTFEEWLDQPTVAPYRNRDNIPSDTHPTARFVYETLMKEFAK